MSQSRILLNLSVVRTLFYAKHFILLLIQMYTFYIGDLL